jgi:hypothetical protein
MRHTAAACGRRHANASNASGVRAATRPEFSPIGINRIIGVIRRSAAAASARHGEPAGAGQRIHPAWLFIRGQAAGKKGWIAQAMESRQSHRGSGDGMQDREIDRNWG